VHRASTLEMLESRENDAHVSTWVIVVDPDSNVTLTTWRAGAIVVEVNGPNSKRKTFVVLLSSPDAPLAPLPPDEPLPPLPDEPGANDSTNWPLLNTVPLDDVA